MKLPKNAELYEVNQLAIIYTIPEGMRAVGKRVGKNCPLTPAERKHYVSINGASAQMVKYLMETRGIGLSPAWEMLKKARGTSTLYRHGVVRRVFSDFGRTI